jgi:hypothetical protein
MQARDIRSCRKEANAMHAPSGFVTKVCCPLFERKEKERHSVEETRHKGETSRDVSWAGVIEETETQEAGSPALELAGEVNVAQGIVTQHYWAQGVKGGYERGSATEYETRWSECMSWWHAVVQVRSPNIREGQIVRGGKGTSGRKQRRVLPRSSWSYISILDPIYGRWHRQQLGDWCAGAQWRMTLCLAVQHYNVFGIPPLFLTFSTDRQLMGSFALAGPLCMLRGSYGDGSLEDRTVAAAEALLYQGQPSSFIQVFTLLVPCVLRMSRNTDISTSFLNIVLYLKVALLPSLSLVNQCDSALHQEIWHKLLFTCTSSYKLIQARTSQKVHKSEKSWKVTCVSLKVLHMHVTKSNSILKSQKKVNKFG